MSQSPRRPTRPRATLVPLLALGALAVSAGAGCASGSRREPEVSAGARRSACLVAADSVAPSPAISAAFDDTADARRALLAASRVAPVRLDCEGRPSPGLAVAWSRDTSGRFWTLELVAAADSGPRWTAATLASAWRADPSASAALRWSGVTSLVPLDERRLVAGFAAPAPQLPTVFADRALAVPRTTAIDFTLTSPASGDLRDGIDQGTDLVRASDPALLAYARRRSGTTTIALPWDRTYVLLLPAGSAGVGSAIPADTVAFRTALASEAVQADARAASHPFWWQARAACVTGAQATAPGRPTDVVAYPAADPVARDLAERIVALARTRAGADVPARAGTAITARGLSADSFAVGLRLGADRGIVLGVPRHAPVPCRESAAWPPGAAVIPLVDTRPYAALRRGGPALVVEWDGAIRPAEAADTAAGTP